MPVYTRQNFDKRTDAEKRNSWTVTALGNHPNSIGRIQKLRDLVADTIAIPNESEAWDRYWHEARKYLRHDQKTSALESELFVSFRFARQRAYNRAIDDLIHDDQDILWGIRLETQDDPMVRPQHVKLHGVTLPPEHKFWQDLNLPLDWNCRCYKIPLMKATAQSGGYTPEKDIPTIPKGFE